MRESSSSYCGSAPEAEWSSENPVATENNVIFKFGRNCEFNKPTRITFWLLTTLCKCSNICIYDETRARGGRMDVHVEAKRLSSRQWTHPPKNWGNIPAWFFFSFFFSSVFFCCFLFLFFLSLSLKDRQLRFALESFGVTSRGWSRPRGGSKHFYSWIYRAFPPVEETLRSPFLSLARIRLC